MILEILLIMIILILSYIVYNLYRKSEKLTKIVSTQQDIQSDVLERMINTVEELRQVDLKGSFEADDEVGFTWKNINEIINVLSTDVINAFNTENKEEVYGKKSEK